ncbi:MAG: DUF465 domain-containing protein [Alphaproteobacteria bacterium]|nr:DUF465 domain-containing protein [Alphaproteobacteria bacterium]
MAVIWGPVVRKIERWTEFRVASDDTPDKEELRQRLQALQSEHRDLDDVISRISGEAPFDQLQIQRLKKRKLVLKDEISRLEDILLPDIIA